jgi:diacylglycerol kinase (ATP)
VTKYRIAIILNGISRSRKSFHKEWLPTVRRHFDADVFETTRPGHATELALDATNKKYTLIISAGGDGTLNEVVNGVLEANPGHDQMPALIVLSFGSGNDFARAIGQPSSPDALVELIKNSPIVPVDVAIVKCQHEGKPIHHHFVNVADAGMGPSVVSRVMRKRKFLNGTIAYYISILQTFINYRPIEISVNAGSWQWSGITRSIAVANGKYYGHGLCVAPDANLNDGLLNVFVCGNVSVLDFIRYSNTLKQGKYLSIPDVFYRTATSVSLRSDEACLIECDGEIIGALPAEITLSSIQIPMLLGARKV